MINLDLKDLRKEYIYIIRYCDKEFIKTTNKKKIKKIIEFLHVLGITDFHLYVVNVRKEYDYVGFLRWN